MTESTDHSRMPWRLPTAVVLTGLLGASFAIALGPAAQAETPAGETLTSTSCAMQFRTGDDPITAMVTNPINFEKFDPTLGPLLAIRVAGNYRDGGYLGVEHISSDPIPSDLSFSYTAEVAMESKLFGERTLYLSSGERASTLQKLGPYDGVSDFSGTSGTILESQVDFTQDYDPASSIGAQFVGTGMLEYLESAGITTSNEAGNLDMSSWKTGSQQNGGANYTPESPDGSVGVNACVTYTYRKAAPPPTTIAPPPPTVTPTPTTVTPTPITTTTRSAELRSTASAAKTEELAATGAGGTLTTGLLALGFLAAGLALVFSLRPRRGSH